MTHLDIALPQLKESVLGMMQIVKNQVEKSESALHNMDHDLAHEIIMNEKLVNAYELKIDIDCENILALYNPVAVDLRFVLTSYNINSTLERIADNAKGIAKFILDFESPINEEIKQTLRFEEMFKMVLFMLDTIYTAYEHEDTELARKIFKQDKSIDKIYKLSLQLSIDQIQQYPEHVKEILCLYTIIRKLERIGDLLENIAEELIYHIEAKVMKHRNLMKQNKADDSTKI